MSSQPNFIASPESLLGQLQRGRGEGYRRLLQTARTEAHALLVECITHDPRMDSQVESREWYYAKAAVETDLPLEPLVSYLRAHDDKGQTSWNTPLTIMTLTALAGRGYSDARDILCDYISWGEWWNWPIDDLLKYSDDRLSSQIAAAVERHFPTERELDEAMTEWPQEDFFKLSQYTTRIATSLAKVRGKQAPEQPGLILPTSFSVHDLLDLAERTNLKGAAELQKAIASIVRPTDVDLLVSSVSIASPLRARVALAGLEKVASPSLREWLQNLWLTIPFRHEPSKLDSGQSRVIMRQAIRRLFRALPAESTLPLAREWFNNTDEAKHFIAEDLLQHHATLEDVLLLRSSLRRMLSDDDSQYHCRLIKAFNHLPNIGLVPELLEIFHQFRFSTGRAYAAEALWISAPDVFQEMLAYECLWDCEDLARETGASAAGLNVPEARHRLEEMADDHFEEETVKAAARIRVR